MKVPKKSQLLKEHDGMLQCPCCGDSGIAFTGNFKITEKGPVIDYRCRNSGGVFTLWIAERVVPGQTMVFWGEQVI